MTANGVHFDYGRQIVGLLRAEKLVDVSSKGRVFMWTGRSSGAALLRAASTSTPSSNSSHGTARSPAWLSIASSWFATASSWKGEVWPPTRLISNSPLFGGWHTRRLTLGC